MNLKLLVVSSLAVFLVAAGTASAERYIEDPTIHEYEAEEDVIGFLHKHDPAWRYRTEGYIDCRNGRINRYSWACRVGFYKGRQCKLGRVRVTNQALQGNEIYYNVDFRWRPC